MRRVPFTRGGENMKIKEVFFTIQGEGSHTGRPAVFCRFAGCNLWSGREKDRSTAVCQFCDTDFLGGFSFTHEELRRAIVDCWGDRPGRKFVVFTGGEPALQLTSALIYALQRDGFDVAVESNGSLPLPSGVYWKTVSPKAGADLVVTSGSELKVVWPQDLDLDALSRLDFRERYLQPMDGHADSTKMCIDMVTQRPNWRLSLQTHKWAGIR